MTDFTLTTSDDNFSGSDFSDHFTGPSGGNDTLYGHGGADLFELDSGEAGIVRGGSGMDTVKAVGFDLGTLTFVSVEKLDIAQGGIAATADQLASFKNIYSSSGSTDINISLTGTGGGINFGGEWTGTALLHVDGYGAGGGFEIIGTDNVDYLAGSDFTDTIFGGAGDDQLTGRGGTGDQLYGGEDNDTITSYSSASTLDGGFGNDNLYGYSDDTLFGGDGRDILQVSFGTNTLSGGFGNDVLKLGAGSDTLLYGQVEESLRNNHDRVVDFDSSADIFKLWFAVAGVDGTVTADSLKQFNNVLDAGHLEQDHAVLVDIGSKTFMVVDANGTAGFQAGEDLVVRLDGVTTLTTDNFTV